MEEITRLANLPVYTREGTYVGNVKNIILDLPNRRIDSILIGRTNPGVVEDGRDIAIPYRWVQSFNDILLLRHFPARVATSPVDPEATAGGETEFERVEAPPEAAPAPAKRTVARRA